MSPSDDGNYFRFNRGKVTCWHQNRDTKSANRHMFRCKEGETCSEVEVRCSTISAYRAKYMY